MKTGVHRIGIMGCGKIFPAYMRGLARFEHLEVVHCADVISERALLGHQQYGIPRWGGPDDLLDDEEVEIVLNLTPPTTHMEVSWAALEAGKHVYSEKPITTDLGDANRLLALAEAKGLALGAAPDTFLGSWGATSRAIVDSGLLGEIVGATAFAAHNRVETWHPEPTFLFKPGGGPSLDRGPYYVTALVNLLGPVAEVGGMSRMGPPQRLVTAPNRLVDVVDVEIPTHATGLLRFAAGVVATVVFSSDVWATEAPYIELYGTEGTLSLPHPNWFDGDVRIKGTSRDAEWQTVPPVVPVGAQRGEGIADLVASFEEGRQARTSAALARHVLEVLLALERSAQERAFVPIQSRCERPVWVDLPMPHLARAG
jgi:predicted dehydrogenase